MKITQKQLKRIIKEERRKLQLEAGPEDDNIRLEYLIPCKDQAQNKSKHTIHKGRKSY